MNLFWKKVFGSLASTAKFEANEKKLLEAMHRYDEVEKSAELEEYKALALIVKSSQFQEKKKTLQNRKYKDTEEYRNTKKLHKLESNPDIKRYYSVVKSDILKQYLTFKAGPNFEQLRDKETVQKSDKLQQLKQFEKSKDYKTYARFHDSYIIKELEELKKTVSDPKFVEANKFWSNDKRWYSTPEYVKEQRYYQLAKNQDIVFYNKQNPETFKDYRALTQTLNEEFEYNTMAKSLWVFGFQYKNSNLIGQHSFANEKQAYSFGKNTGVEDGVLKISTRNEKTIARAWDATKGFLEKEFHFTSDVLNTAKAFRQKEGIFSVKLRCSGNIHHAFWLGGDDKLPHINIFHYNGKQITLGNANENVVDGINITGINPSQFYIYTLKWTTKELIWFVNNLEVYRTSNQVPQENMYVGINSFISEKQKGSTGFIEIDWIRVYK